MFSQLDHEKKNILARPPIRVVGCGLGSLSQNQEDNDGQQKNLEHSIQSLKLEIYISNLNQQNHNNLDSHHHHI